MLNSIISVTKRTKEIYVIMLSQHFYENIVRKGYLVFDADDLLNIKEIGRAHV